MWFLFCKSKFVINDCTIESGFLAMLLELLFISKKKFKQKNFNAIDFAYYWFHLEKSDQNFTLLSPQIREKDRNFKVTFIDFFPSETKTIQFWPLGDIWTFAEGTAFDIDNASLYKYQFLHNPFNIRRSIYSERLFRRPTHLRSHFERTCEQIISKLLSNNPQTQSDSASINQEGWLPIIKFLSLAGHLVLVHATETMALLAHVNKPF